MTTVSWDRTAHLCSLVTQNNAACPLERLKTFQNIYYGDQDMADEQNGTQVVQGRTEIDSKLRSLSLNGKVPTAHLRVNGNKILIFFVKNIS